MNSIYGTKQVWTPQGLREVRVTGWAPDGARDTSTASINETEVWHRLLTQRAGQEIEIAELSEPHTCQDVLIEK